MEEEDEEEEEDEDAEEVNEASDGAICELEGDSTC